MSIDFYNWRTCFHGSSFHWAVMEEHSQFKRGTFYQIHDQVISSIKRLFLTIINNKGTQYSSRKELLKKSAGLFSLVSSWQDFLFLCSQFLSSISRLAAPNWHGSLFSICWFGSYFSQGHALTLPFTTFWTQGFVEDFVKYSAAIENPEVWN